jgi:3D-(3,5/4)-trihydroxycyclohexane-1,2-dione acylhydrolase (decyclizing)
MSTTRYTMAQAIIHFLKNQFIERDGVRSKFFKGCFGIFGHGNVAGIGQALHQTPEFRYYQTRNEQAMVHTAAAYAKMKNRLATFACTTSIGPGATNMVTAATGATINRLPVLLLPGDIFSHRRVDPVLQQLEMPYTQDISANDVFKPISRYWDRISRAEQIITSLPAAMRVLTSQSDTGTVTLCLPQDVQVEAFEYPDEFFEERVWYIPRPVPDAGLLQRAAEAIRASKKPVIVAGGGVIYSEASEALENFISQTGIPVGETQAGKGSLRFNDPLNLGAIGVTGTFGANIMAQEADLIIGIGTRYSDFTTASKTLFRNPEVRFININLAEFDAHKHSALPLTGDARETLKYLSTLLSGWSVDSDYRGRAEQFNRDWDEEVEKIYQRDHQPFPSQGEVIGVINNFSDEKDVVLCAAGSAPGDLHKLWRTRDPKGYHLEYGYSCMGYEIAGGLGAKMAAPEREIYVIVGDGSYLMMAQEIVTSIQEGVKLIIILINNQGYGSIGGLSRSLGIKGFGTRYLFRDEQTGILPDDTYTPSDAAERQLPVDLAANAQSLGAHVIKTQNVRDLKVALSEAKLQDRTTLIYIETDRYAGVPGYESWWDVPVAEVSNGEEVQKIREKYEEDVRQERYYLKA